MKVVELAAVEPQPWRNGGGVTYALLTLAAEGLAIDDAQPFALPVWSLAFSADACGRCGRMGGEAASAAYWIEARPR